PEPAPPPAEQVPRPQVTRGIEMPEEVTVRPEPPAELPVVAEPPPGSSPCPAPRSATPVEERTDLAMSRAEAMISEARRLFGPRYPGPDRPPGPVSGTWINEITADRDNDCTPRPRPPRDPSIPPELGVVTGRVYRAGTSQALPGAFLQILGTGYSTYADDQGVYSLEFDRALVDNCRTQYVQVSRDGFAPQRLILSLGSRSANDIRMSRR